MGADAARLRGWLGASAPVRCAWGGLVLLVASGCGPELQPLMGMPLAGLTEAELERFEAGRAAFEKQVVEEEGLGPLFNDFGCADCHNVPVVGGFSNRVNIRFGRAGEPFEDLAELGGSLLQFQTTVPSCEEFVPPEADVQALRGTPHCFGLGLVEAVPDEELVGLQGEGPEVFGRVHWVRSLEDGRRRVGRFGWKAQLATVIDFTADAAIDEMGLTNRLFPNENAPNGDASKLLLGDFHADPEDRPDESGMALIDRIADFQRFLAPPPQTPLEGMKGEAVFERIGCADCHVPKLRAAHSPSVALSNRLLRPYSNFLLHDMGTLGDGIAQGEAGPRMMRTAPLWGLAARDAMNHDFKSTGDEFEPVVRSAIERHDGEARASRDLFLALSDREHEQLVAFLGSLGRAEFDWDRDHDVDADDAAEFARAMRERPTGITPDDPEAVFDVDRDGDLDAVDLAALGRALWRDR